jgi:hypothetical protein
MNVKYKDELDVFLRKNNLALAIQIFVRFFAEPHFQLFVARTNVCSRPWRHPESI